MPLNAPPLKEREILENESVVELNVNDPDTVDPEFPVRVSFEKLSFESANAGRHAHTKSAAQTLIRLKYRRITVFNFRRSTTRVSVHSSLALSRLIILATGCKHLQHWPEMLGRSTKRPGSLPVSEVVPRPSADSALG
jgi:hypothetical protein